MTECLVATKETAGSRALDSLVLDRVAAGREARPVHRARQRGVLLVRARVRDAVHLRRWRDARRGRQLRERRVPRARQPGRAAAEPNADAEAEPELQRMIDQSGRKQKKRKR